LLIVHSSLLNWRKGSSIVRGFVIHVV
jgi:hypothetical protein